MSGTGLGEPVEVVHAIDSVKLISPSITTPGDPSTFLQDRYSLTDSRRLLLRFEKLRDFKDGVLTHGRKIQVKLTVTDQAQASVASDQLRLCFMSRSWMMGATWHRASPFGGDSERWSREGGDYGECIRGEAAQAVLVFDVTTWFIQYPGDFNTNYGFILMTAGSVPVEVYGENLPSVSPKMVWMENS